MIVPVSSEKYDNLFAEATEFLKKMSALDEGEVIDSLNAYYGHMKDFYNAAAKDRSGYKYILMPLHEVGEDPFKVDLNTRTITVPAAFSKIGGVQADQMAELIVFTADRYFDYMDLANTLIYVQWQLPDDKHTTGATEVTIIDLETEPGKIRFAWPLHNVITAHSGVVRFSIRFFLFDSQDKLSYSLNTLDASLTIKPALDPSAKINPEQTGGLFENAIINSAYTHDGLVPPVYPSFEEPGLDMTLVNSEDFVRYLEEAEEGKKTRVAKLGADDRLTMKVQAVVADAGVLSYRWMFREDGSTAWSPVEVGQSELYEPAKLAIDAVTKKPYLNFRDAYFTKDENETYTPYLSYNIPTNDNDEYDFSLYEKYSIYELKPVTEGGSNVVAGTYAAVAENTISNLKKEKWSTYCYLPGPKDIEFKDEVFTVTTDALGKQNVTVNIVEDNNSPAVTPVWYYDAKSSTGALSSAERDLNKGLDASGNADMSTVAPGWYAARVVTNLNRKNVEKVTPKTQVIYAKAQIENVVPEGETAYNLGPGETQELKIVVNVPLPEGFTSADEISSDLYRNLTYKWQYHRNDSTVWRDITSGMVSDTDITAPIYAINDETGSITVRNVEDMTAYNYRCIVTNTLGKDSVSYQMTDMFLIY